MKREYSVLMSVYYKETVEHFLRSVESMLMQTIPPEQFVIVMDGPLPTDLASSISDYAMRFPDLFTIISLEKNAGLGAALNKGLLACRNDLVARMDSDDISFPERCEKQLLCFSEDQDLSIVGTYIQEFQNDPNDSALIRKVPTEHPEIVKFARRRSPFNHPTVMFKANEVLRCGGYGTSGRKEDLELFPAMVNNGCKSKNIPEVLLYYRADSCNLSRRKSWKNCKDSIQVIYKNHRNGYSSFGDFLFVSFAQLLFFLMPTPIARFFSDHFLRHKK